jgi:hypothetical protein
MKLIWTDNFNRETVSEHLVADHVREAEKLILLNALRATCSANGPDWYKLVEDDYELYKFEPEDIQWMKSRFSMQDFGVRLGLWSSPVTASTSPDNGSIKQEPNSVILPSPSSKSGEAQMKKSGFAAKRRQARLPDPAPRPRDNFYWGEIQSMHKADRKRLNFASDRVLEPKT